MTILAKLSLLSQLARFRRVAFFSSETENSAPSLNPVAEG
jgi:hypothetical protein